MRYGTRFASPPIPITKGRTIARWGGVSGFRHVRIRAPAQLRDARRNEKTGSPRLPRNAGWSKSGVLLSGFTDVIPASRTGQQADPSIMARRMNIAARAARESSPRSFARASSSTNVQFVKRLLSLVRWSIPNPTSVLAPTEEPRGLLFDSSRAELLANECQPDTPRAGVVHGMLLL